MGKFVVAVQQEADRVATLTTLKRKWNGFEVKMPHLALESIEN